MRLGLFTDALGHRPLADALAWLAANVPDVRDVEVGTGGYSSAPHCHRSALIESDDARRRWIGELEERGFRLAALNVSGNPLESAEHDQALRETIRLAAVLGVERVICMSGGSPVLAGGGWMPGLEEALGLYWGERVLPYWEEIAALADQESEGLRLCLELEPGAAVFNVSTFERVAALGPNLAVNLDPSHFFWQRIDPLASIARLGDRVAFAHAKDTVVDEDRVRLDGLVDRTTWRYAAVGRAHGADWWRAFADALQEVGYDAVLSIEWEDELVTPEASIVEAASVLADATAKVAA